MLHQASNRFNPDDLWQKDHDHFLHPYTHFDSFKQEGSLVLVEGEGCYVKDVEGRRYFDGIGGMWCVNAGYGRKEIAETMAEQALQLCYTTTFVDVTNAPAAELAAKLASLAPEGLNHVAFATSGSCGIDTAIRLAHYYQSRRGETDRKYIISRKNSYHGSTYLGMTVGLRDGDQSPHFRYVSDLVHHLSAPYPYRRPDGMSLEAFSDFLVDEFRHKIEALGAEQYRGLHRRAGAGLGRGHHAAAQLSAAHAQAMPRQWHPVHRRRSGDRLRTARPHVCVAKPNSASCPTSS